MESRRSSSTAAFSSGDSIAGTNFWTGADGNGHAGGAGIPSMCTPVSSTVKDPAPDDDVANDPVSDFIDFLDVFDEEVLLNVVAFDFSEPVDELGIDNEVGFKRAGTEVAILITLHRASLNMDVSLVSTVSRIGVLAEAPERLL